jgi:hypothetical protein
MNEEEPEQGTCTLTPPEPPQKGGFLMVGRGMRAKNQKCAPRSETFDTVSRKHGQYDVLGHLYKVTELDKERSGNPV